LDVRRLREGRSMNEHEDIRTLAAGIKMALEGMYIGRNVQFLLVTVMQRGGADVTVNTITEITDHRQIEQIGQHLIEMSLAQQERPDTSVEGHA
jgi:hypothetical protein